MADLVINRAATIIAKTALVVVFAGRHWVRHLVTMRSMLTLMCFRGIGRDLQQCSFRLHRIGRSPRQGLDGCSLLFNRPTARFLWEPIRVYTGKRLGQAKGANEITQWRARPGVSSRAISSIETKVRR